MTTATIESLAREVQVLRDKLALAEGRAERLAVDALCALSAAGIATPEKGYSAEPHVLTADIQKLARERDGALARLRALDSALMRGLGALVLMGEPDWVDRALKKNRNPGDRPELLIREDVVEIVVRMRQHRDAALRDSEVSRG